LQTSIKYLIAFSVVSSCALSVGISTKPASEEESIFSAEDTAVKPVSLPSEIVAILAQDARVQEELRIEGVSAEALPSRWFVLSEVHLKSPGEREFIVMGTGPLLGANVTTFWVFRPVSRNLVLILRATAHTLALNDTRSRGYRDIELISATAVQYTNVVYQFNGETYERQTSSRPQ
jgi:hypothetical protein